MRKSRRVLKTSENLGVDVRALLNHQLTGTAQDFRECVRHVLQATFSGNRILPAFESVVA